MDPIGFALENFDPVGRFRTFYANGLPVQADGLLPDGRAFVGALQLANALTTNSDFSSCFSKKITTYALGRLLSGADQCAAQQVTASQNLGKSGRFSDLLGALVSSKSFLYRQGEAP